MSKEYPKYLYKKSDNKRGFESVLCKNKEHQEALSEDHFESPADFGVVTAPNPQEEADKKLKAVVKAEKPKSEKNSDKK